MVYEPKTGRGKLNKGFKIDGRKNTTKEIEKRFDDFVGVDNIKKKIGRK